MQIPNVKQRLNISSENEWEKDLIRIEYLFTFGSFLSRIPSNAKADKLKLKICHRRENTDYDAEQVVFE